MKKSKEQIIAEIGLTINNNKAMLDELREIYKDSLRLPQSSDVSAPLRMWCWRLYRLQYKAWREAASYYEEGELGITPPAVLEYDKGSNGEQIPVIFKYTYCEES